jgi:hypothetical protein
MFKTVLAPFVLALCALLTACGGGGDDQSQDSVPLGAKVCELKQVLAGSLIPRSDINNYTALPTPELLPAGDDVFSVSPVIAQPGFQPLPAGAELVVYVQSYAYRASPETLLWECVLRGLSAGDHVALRGGPRGEGQVFSVGAVSRMTLPDGKTAASSWAGLRIEY